MNPWILWTGVAWLVVLGLALILVLVLTPGSRVDRLARAMGLPLTDELRNSIAGQPRSAGVAALTSSAVGIVLAFILLLATNTTDMFEVLWAYILVIFVALGVGTTIGGLRAERKRTTAATRFARLRAVTLSDYLSPLRQWGPRVVIALLVVGLGLRALLSPRPFTHIPVFLVVYAVASVATLIVVELGMRRIIRRGQPAGSELELAWDDALKGRVLYSVGVAPLYLGSYGLLVASAFGGEGRRSAAVIHAIDIQLLFGLAAMVVNIVVLIVDAATGYQQRYLRRLWPDFAAELRASEADRHRAEAAANAARNAPRTVAKAASEK